MSDAVSVRLTEKGAIKASVEYPLDPSKPRMEALLDAVREAGKFINAQLTEAINEQKSQQKSEAQHSTPMSTTHPKYDNPEDPPNPKRPKPL